jgi:hypothetical protein
MQTNITVALIAGAFTAVGWLVTYILKEISDRKRHSLTAQLEHVKQQLEELYGPLTFLVLEGRRTFNNLLETLGRDIVFDNDHPLPASELKIWLFWVENDFLPRNRQIKELISAKTYLIEGGKVPNSFLKFIEHYSSWAIHHLRWKNDGTEYSWKSSVNWPSSFEEDVVDTFHKLKKRHAELIGRLGDDH